MGLFQSIIWLSDAPEITPVEQWNMWCLKKDYLSSKVSPPSKGVEDFVTWSESKEEHEVGTAFSEARWKPIESKSCLGERTRERLMHEKRDNRARRKVKALSPARHSGERSFVFIMTALNLPSCLLNSRLHFTLLYTLEINLEMSSL